MFARTLKTYGIGLLIGACISTPVLGGNDCCFISQGIGNAMKCVSAADVAACATAGGTVFAPDFNCVTDNDKSCTEKAAPNDPLVCVNESGGVECTPSIGACCNTDTNQCYYAESAACKAAGNTYRGDGTVCGTDGTCIPTVSEWGVVVMAMLVLTAGTIVVMRRRAVATN